MGDDTTSSSVWLPPYDLGGGLMDDPIRQEAEKRHQLHVEHPTHRPLSENYELVGLRGEKALADRFGLKVDMMRRPNGDGGIDNILCLNGINYPVDVKCARKPFNLIVEQGKIKSGNTIYILAQYFDASDTAVLLKWEWGWNLMASPVRDFGKGVYNHYIHVSKLRDLWELEIRHSQKKGVPSMPLSTPSNHRHQWENI